VRIRVHACGVCRSDLWILDGADARVTYPRVPGHEVAGVLEAVGSEVTSHHVGQRVGVGWHGGQCVGPDPCPACREGDFIHCQNRIICGVHYDGGYAEHMVAPAVAVAPIPDEIELAEAAPLLCAGVTTFNALRHAGGRPGDLAVVEGVGGLGHLGIQFARAMGFRVVAVSPGDLEESALNLGAELYVDNLREDPTARIQAMGGAKVILCTSPSAESMSRLVPALGSYGRMMIVGVPSTSLTVNPDDLIDRRAAIVGWACGHAADSRDCLIFAASQGVRPMIEPFELERANEAVAAMREGRVRFRAVLMVG
jgi:D-arabinose 1-dehydrogenase-like Zn-dependent alcohol dehydrogenase